MCGEVQLSLDDLPPIFRDCVAEDPGRYKLNEPWRRDGYAYATDGRIIVRVLSPGDDVGAGPKAESLSWDRDLYCDEPVEVPLVPLRDKIASEYCSTCGETERDLGHEAIEGVRLSHTRLRVLRYHGCQLYLRKDVPGDVVQTSWFTCGDNVDGLIMGMSKE